MTNTITTSPPPASPPPELSSGARTTVRVGLVVAAAVLLVGVLVALAGVAFGISRFRVVAESSALPDTLRTLEIDIDSAPAAVRIRSDRSVDEPRVDMRMIDSSRSDARPLSVSADGTSARVSVDPVSSELLRRARAGEITIVVPDEMARRLTVTVRQEMGAVFADADLDQLTAHVREGAVVLGGSARRIDIDNDNGEVVSRRPISVTESFRAATATGDIDVEFTDVPETVDVETRTGDIDLTVPLPGPFLVNATTGDERGATVVKVPQTRDAGEATAVITARSDTGDVVVDDRN
ncbi:hypothetical protein CRI77_20065 [Mycolicibacterium duvalii]|uniref:Uncharacterized protein n=1 Tax=Mycolicibacterium duvalii TaxID=39688 RepID=A0A7I7JW09_9MYCO|nr:hypothetical protein [Mycolicibacterium duvalii]MCV7369260.1 hypothetical protein [Mycolicibacterium duvalii]PEG37680.1 hypothetical protein CRI77_20065 [Mycolicibacterium duvalii]BBX15444.1 hypothetical protein MDUV_03040 [Mycolicibacterium duvalii]